MAGLIVQSPWKADTRNGMSNRLSHSQINSYLSCPEKWNLHYNHRLRGKYQSAALCFGTSLDQSVTAMLKGLNYLDVYSKVSTFQAINSKEIHLPFCTNIAYSVRDFDADLLTEACYKKISVEASQESFGKEEIKKLLADKEAVGGFENLPEELKRLHNYIHWLSLYQKGLIMLESFRTNILPNFTKIHSTQEVVNLSNGTDSVIGYIDLVAEYKGYDKPIIFDLKTSSQNYDKNSVLSSAQLGLYVHGVSEKYNNTKLGGYIVINKNINKNKIKTCSVCKHDGTGSKARKCDNEIKRMHILQRCNGEWIETIKPTAFIQVLINEIPQQFETLLIDNIDNVNKAISSGIIYKNLNSCVQGWGPCQFYNKCHYGSDNDIIKV